ncbi:MAG: glycosyltransferase, partial [Planctomycetota bacterium]
MGCESPMISVIIPLYNEEENISFLFQELERLFKKPPETMELILVDDGSKDQTFTLLVEAQKNWQYGRCRILRLRRNFGKGAALQAGLDLAYGEWIFTMDGDGQDNPLEFFKL